MNVGRAFIAGVCGTLIMSLVMIGLRAAGLDLHVEQQLATMLGLNAWIVGFIVFLIIGGLVGIIYACVFEWILHQAGIGAGMLTGAYNSIFAGFFWSFAGGPGPFWMRLGAGGIGSLFLVHFVYGATVGVIYKTEHVRVEA
jgi:hypothetical protein